MIFGNFLAPIHQCTDLPFRLLCQRYGAESACVPLISADMAARHPEKVALVDARPPERNLGIQVFGGDPSLISKAAGHLAEAFPFASYLCLNCGCPSSRTMDAGAGSAMLGRPEAIGAALEGMSKASGKPVCVKMRLRGGFGGTLDIVRVAERAGADFAIIHGRTPSQGYAGKADWETIRKVREGAGIPIVGNGDIQSIERGRELVRDGFCDSFMVGRAAMANPMLFCGAEPDGIEGRMSLLGEYASLHRRHLGEPDLKTLRARALWFVKGVSGACSIRAGIARARSAGELAALGGLHRGF